MEHTEILQQDYLDILFNKRNKLYGGYELRRHYDQRMRKAAMIMLASALLFCGLSLWHKQHAAMLTYNTTTVAPTIVEIKPPVKIEPKITKPPVQPPQQAKPIKMKIFTPPIIDPKNDVPDDKAMTRNDELKNMHPGPANSTGDSADIVSDMPVKKGGTGVLTTVATTHAPIRYVSQMPVFDGDMEAYIGSHLNYPSMARDNNIDGSVAVEFVVNEDGSVSNAKIVHSIGGGCDEEALRTVNGMPKWKPGKQNGIPVKVYFTLPIKFVLR